MEEADGTGGEGSDGSHHAGLEWEGILRSFQEGRTIQIDRQLLEQDWGKPLLTQLPWEDVLFASLLPCLQVNYPMFYHLLTTHIFQPNDWLALSRTCKACNKMVGSMKTAQLCLKELLIEILIVGVRVHKTKQEIGFPSRIGIRQDIRASHQVALILDQPSIFFPDQRSIFFRSMFHLS